MRKGPEARLEERGKSGWVNKILRHSITTGRLPLPKSLLSLRYSFVRLTKFPNVSGIGPEEQAEEKKEKEEKGLVRGFVFLINDQIQTHFFLNSLLQVSNVWINRSQFQFYMQQFFTTGARDEKTDSH